MEQNRIHSPEAATDEPAFPDNPAGRHDGFTPKRRRKFLKTLRKTGCVRDACRKAGISDTAAYKLRRRDPAFAALWAAALGKVGSDVELLAWQRAVDGIEEPVFAYGKQIGVRRRYDSNLLRMLLQSSKPGKYGGQGFGSRKAIEKEIRKKIAAEQQEATGGEDIEEVRERIAMRIDRLRQRMIRDGELVQDEDGYIVPPGYVKIVPSGADPNRPDGDADWSKPEPDRPPSDAPAEPCTPPQMAEKRRAEPRITTFGGF